MRMWCWKKRQYVSHLKLRRIVPYTSLRYLRKVTACLENLLTDMKNPLQVVGSSVSKMSVLQLTLVDHIFLIASQRWLVRLSSCKSNCEVWYWEETH